MKIEDFLRIFDEKYSKEIVRMLKIKRIFGF